MEHYAYCNTHKSHLLFPVTVENNANDRLWQLTNLTCGEKTSTHLSPEEGCLGFALLYHMITGFNSTKHHALWWRRDVLTPSVLVLLTLCEWTPDHTMKSVLAFPWWRHDTETLYWKKRLGYINMISLA